MPCERRFMIARERISEYGGQPADATDAFHSRRIGVTDCHNITAAQCLREDW